MEDEVIKAQSMVLAAGLSPQARARRNLMTRFKTGAARVLPYNGRAPSTPDGWDYDQVDEDDHGTQQYRSQQHPPGSFQGS